LWNKNHAQKNIVIDLHEASKTSFEGAVTDSRCEVRLETIFFHFLF